MKWEVGLFWRKCLTTCFLQHITFKSSRFKENKNIRENKSKDERNLFWLKKLKKETNCATMKCVRNLFKLKNKTNLLNTEYLQTLEIVLSMKKQIIINKQGKMIFGITVILNIKVNVIENHYQLKFILTN